MYECCRRMWKLKKHIIWEKSLVKLTMLSFENKSLVQLTQRETSDFDRLASNTPSTPRYPSPPTLCPKLFAYPWRDSVSWEADFLCTAHKFFKMYNYAWHWQVIHSKAVKK